MVTPNANAMYGVYGKLACSLLLLSLVVVISTCCSDDGEGATTHVDGDWYIYHDTTLSDGTWVVNGSVYVTYNKLTLENAQLIFNITGSGIARLSVGREAEMEAYGSEIVGNGSGMLVEINGDTVLDNTTVRGFRWSSTNVGITHLEGELLLDHCRLENGYILVRSNSSVIMRDCVLTGFSDIGLQMTHSTGTPGSRAVV